MQNEERMEETGFSVQFLGTGTSHGVPSIACRCATCTSPDPRNRRARCSVVVRSLGKTLLIDTAPELREQAIRYRLDRVDAVLFTHSHADHIFGLDDVRRFNDLKQGPMSCFGRRATLEDLRQSFRYVFMRTQEGGGKPRLDLVPIEEERFVAEGIPVDAIPVWHGELEVTAFRVGAFAYVTDVSRIPDYSMQRLRGLHTLVLGALRHEPHPTHFSIPQALAVVAELQPRRAFFTHLSHSVDHRTVEATFPAHVRLAYDGLILQVPGGGGPK
jgi:phosphoribosyl 1,2-cyclic phosphate phosphodiesterase